MLTAALSFWIVELIVKTFALPHVLFHIIQLHIKEDNCQGELILVNYFAQNRVFNTWCYTVLQAYYFEIWIFKNYTDIMHFLKFQNWQELHPDYPFRCTCLLNLCLVSVGGTCFGTPMWGCNRWVLLCVWSVWSVFMHENTVSHTFCIVVYFVYCNCWVR